MGNTTLFQSMHLSLLPKKTISDIIAKKIMDSQKYMSVGACPLINYILFFLHFIAFKHPPTLLALLIDFWEEWVRGVHKKEDAEYREVT
jgi:hypothetical protein